MRQVEVEAQRLTVTQRANNVKALYAEVEAEVARLRIELEALRQQNKS